MWNKAISNYADYYWNLGGTSKGRIIRRFSQSKFEGKKTQNKKTGGLFYLYEIIEIRAETIFPPIKKNRKK